jgi:hypothetical protein
MRRHRFAAELGIRELPRPPVPALDPRAFVLCPVAVFPPGGLGHWQCIQWLYLQAFEQAQAVVQPSLLERDLLAVWN